MTEDLQEKFRAEAEEMVSKNPDLLLGKIKSIVLWSYIYFIFLIVTSSVITIGGIWFLVSMDRIIPSLIWLVVISGFAGFSILKGLLYRAKFEESYLISANTYPKLFGVISELEQKLGVKIDKVYIDSSFNACVTQRSRYGVFGGYENILILGLHYLLLISKDELRSVLAHELAHISNNDSKATGVVFHIRNSWIQILMSVAGKKNIGVKPIIWYLDKTWPKLDAYTFAYSRMCEYKADEFSVKYTDINSWAENIVKSTVSSHYIQAFWGEINELMNVLSEPPKDLNNKFIEYINRPINKDKIEEWVTQTAFEQTKSYDTHPALEERLSAQGVDVSFDSLYKLFTKKSEKNAAQEYLELEYENVLSHFNNKFYENSLKVWNDFVKYREELDVVINKEENGEGNAIENKWVKIDALYKKSGLQSIEPIVDEILTANKDDYDAIFHKAIILLDRNDSEGEIMIENLVAQKKILYSSAYNFLYKYYSKNNLRDKAKELDEIIKVEKAKNEKINNDLNTLSNEDYLSEQDLSKENIEKIVEFGNKNRNEIISIHVAKRTLMSDSSFVTYVISIKRHRWFKLDGPLDSVLINKLINELDVSCVGFIWEDNNTAYGKKVAEIPNSLIFHCKDSELARKVHDFL